jgi:hypothetical protein
MKAHVVLLSALLAVSAAGTANAAPHTKHHHAVHHRAAQAATASKNDWPGNPYMDSRPDQVAAFWRDAFNPLGAQPWR